MANLILDLKSLDDLAWDTSSVTTSLLHIYRHTESFLLDKINWYVKSKRPKQVMARWLRTASILLVALAGLLPVAGEMRILKKLGWEIEPLWATVALGAAAALVALDRFFGYSSAWVRYITAELQLRKILDEFRMDWEAARASWKGTVPGEEQVRQALALCRTIIVQADEIVRDETSRWVTEFQDTLKQLDETVKAKTAATAPGAVTLSITNGDACDAGWAVSIDEGSVNAFSGKTAAITGLAPGIHRFKVEGKIQSQAKRAEAVQNVGAGAVSGLELTLA
jgi:conflict system pore-forming effector with SLATT domain